MNVMVLRKSKKPMSCFQVEMLIFFALFFICFFCAFYFSFTLLIIIRTTKWQSAYINEASKVKKITTMTS